MTERTLVLCERPDGFDVHHAHPRVDRERLRDLLAARGVDLESDRPSPPVDPDPLETGLAWPDVVERLDYRAYDRCLRVAENQYTTSFTALWFGFEPRGGAPRDPRGDGALLATRDGVVEESYDRGWFEGVKSAVADALRRGLVDESQGRAYLAMRVREAAGDREVYVLGE